jgi:hypothetical protein
MLQQRRVCRQFAAGVRSPLGRPPIVRRRLIQHRPGAVGCGIDGHGRDVDEVLYPRLRRQADQAQGASHVGVLELLQRSGCATECGAVKHRFDARQSATKAFLFSEVALGPLDTWQLPRPGYEPGGCPHVGSPLGEHLNQPPSQEPGGPSHQNLRRSGSLTRQRWALLFQVLTRFLDLVH